MRSVVWLIGFPVSWAAARFGVMRQARINAEFYLDAGEVVENGRKT